MNVSSSPTSIVATQRLKTMYIAAKYSRTPRRATNTKKNWPKNAGMANAMMPMSIPLVREF